MTKLSVELPDDLRRKVEARVIESGHGTVEAYIEALLRADAQDVPDESTGGPDHLAIGTADELEALLLRRIEEGGPSIEATPEFWRKLKARATRPTPDARTTP